MTLKQQLDQDLKVAMLAGDKTLATTLRGLKSAILYAEVAAGNREEGLNDEQVTDLFTKELKKRQESADLYTKGGNEEKAREELAEKQVIERYLPSQLSDDELMAIVSEVVAQTGATGAQAMGQVIGMVKAKVGAQAEGSRIAQAVKERLVA